MMMVCTCFHIIIYVGTFDVAIYRDVARILARGFPKSLGNKGAGEGCATRARILEYANTSIVTWPAFSSSLHFAQCASALRKAGGEEEVLERSYAKALN